MPAAMPAAVPTPKARPTIFLDLSTVSTTSAALLACRQATAEEGTTAVARVTEAAAPATLPTCFRTRRAAARLAPWAISSSVETRTGEAPSGWGANAVADW